MKPNLANMNNKKNKIKILFILAILSIFTFDTVSAESKDKTEKTVQTKKKAHKNKHTKTKVHKKLDKKKHIKEPVKVAKKKVESVKVAKKKTEKETIKKVAKTTEPAVVKPKGNDNKVTLKSVLRETVASNPDIKGDKLLYDANSHLIEQAKSGYLPTVDVTSRNGYEHNRVKAKASSISSHVIGRENRMRTEQSVTLNQQIFSGFKTEKDVARAKVQRTQAAKKMEETAENLAFQAANAYISVRRFQRMLSIAKENVATHNMILKKIEQLVEGGRNSAADKYLVISRLKDAETMVHSIEGNLNAAIADYQKVVGKMPGKLGSAKIPEKMLPKNIETAVNVGLDKNRSVILAKSGVDLAKAQLETTDSPFYPTLGIEVDGRHVENNSGQRGISNSASALAVVRYNLSNGGADVAAKKVRAKQVAEQRYRLESARRSSEKDIRNSWTDMISARQQGKEITLAVQNKEKVIELFNQQFYIGTRSLLDVLNTYNELNQAKESLITANATEDTSAIKILSSMGQLVKKFELI